MPVGAEVEAFDEGVGEAAPGAQGLTHRLEPSAQERIVQVLPTSDSVPRLEVDGIAVDQDEGIFSGRAASVVVPAGKGHDLLLTSRGATAGLGLVVFEAG